MFLWLQQLGLRLRLLRASAEWRPRTISACWPLLNAAELRKPRTRLLPVSATYKAGGLVLVFGVLIAVRRPT